MYSYDFSSRSFENTDDVEQAFSQFGMKRICEMHEEDFAREFDMDVTIVGQQEPDNFYFYRDNGCDVLAVAHLDTVGARDERACNFMQTEGGLVVYSRALDDRLGAYIILDLLPKLGVDHDILLTVGEETGRSTASFFDPPKDYNWMIEFDRGGTDVVLYQYEDNETIELVRSAKAVVGDGIFSDISYMDHLGIKGINWGVGYRDYHGPRAHAYLEDTFSMVAKYVRFHDANAKTYLPHEASSVPTSWWGGYHSFNNDDDNSWVNYREMVDAEEVTELPSSERPCDHVFGVDHMHDDDECAQILREFSDDAEVIVNS